MSALDNLMQNQPPPKKNKSPGCVFTLLGFINFFMSIVGISAAFDHYGCAPIVLSWLIFFAGIATPILLRKKFKKNWHWMYLWTIGWATMMLLGILMFSLTSNTPECQANKERIQQVEAEESTREKAESQAKTEDSTSEPVTYKVGESFLVGYTRYQVQGISWKKQLGNSYVGAEADSRYLLVKILVKNEDKTNRMIPTFKLIDENGATYDESSDRMYLGKEAVFLSDLNPGVQKKATLVFDVPPEHHYKLVVSGGYWSGQDALVKLN